MEVQESGDQGGMRGPGRHEVEVALGVIQMAEEHTCVHTYMFLHMCTCRCDALRVRVCASVSTHL